MHARSDLTLKVNVLGAGALIASVIPFLFFNVLLPLNPFPQKKNKLILSFSSPSSIKFERFTNSERFSILDN
jgi:hypothetical protein